MTTESYRSTLPALDAAYWDGTEAGELRLQECGGCGVRRFPPSTSCSQCLSDEFTWYASSGRGTLWSWIRMHRKYFATYADRLPYNVAMIQLDEGPRLIAAVVEDGQQLRCGAPVEVVFERTEGEFTLPEFRIVPSEDQ